MAVTNLFFLTVGLVCISCTLAQWEPWPKPPMWQEKAHMARYLTHYASWGVLAAYSPEYGYPFGSVVSISDGLLKNSSGTPYLYLSDNGDTHHNLNHNNSAGLTLTMSESEICRRNGLDPLEPLCARMILLGKVVLVTDKKELNFAKTALFTRHPAMQYWPKDHGWHVYKLVISGICLLDFYGGATHLPVKDYYASHP
ncbi:hypothetical protein LSH36_273g03089 [Paralvinella palmiformis]|uniref:CREG-like beta-barrel domain-containing protein n=1 Tax=Paralvinella palmiformis TaxID=53620 RepID=A0AAD9JKS6_9ANNE|nr:hypothetical protein LSH36_273g03089 [Paralvinella palmiformis]